MRVHKTLVIGPNTKGCGAMSPNEITAAYLAEVAEGGVPAGELVAAAHRFFDLSMTSFDGRCLSRPVFLDHAEHAQISSDMRWLHGALTDLPRRVFGGDRAAFARAVGLTEVQVSAALRGSSGTPTSLARADAYMDATGFRLLEMNMGSTVGGLDSGQLNKAFLTHPAVEKFVAAHNLTYVDPMAALVETFLAECGLPADARPRVAAVDWPESFATLEPQLRTSADQLAAFGQEFIPCHLGQLTMRDGKVWLDGAPVDMIYRIFMLEDMLHPDGPRLIEPVLAAVERGEVEIFTPLDAELYASKGALALLSDEANRHLYDAGELAILDRVLPWTRMARPGTVTVDGERVDLAEYAIEQQRELILKPTLLHGGMGVVPGWQVDPEEWGRQLTAALDGPYVLQRRIRPVPEPFPAESGPQPWVLAWGIYHGALGYGGAYVRGSTDLSGGVVNQSNGATSTCCFHEMAPVTSG